MKLNTNPSLIQPKTFNRPNPPTQEMVERAKFVDKTYQWKGATTNKVVK
jgi:hypothetical protein